MHPLIFILLPFLTVVFLKLRRITQQKRFARAHNCQPATATFPHNPWFLGYDYILYHARQIRQRTFVRSFSELFDQLGPTYKITVATKQVVHTIDPVNLKSLLSTDNADYTIIPARRALVKTLFGAGVFGAEGAQWIHSRALVRQSFSQFTYDQATYQNHTDLLVRHIRESKGLALDFSSASGRFIIDLVLDLYFGERPCPDDASHELADGFMYLASMGRSLTLFGRRIPYVADALFGREFRTRKNRVEELVDAHLCAAKLANATLSEKGDAGERRVTLAEAMMKHTDDVHTARIEMLSLLLAGNDSIAFLLAEIIWLLARHPAVWEKLRREALAFKVDSALCDADAKAIKKTPYLQCVLNESLRLRPTLSVHGRLSIRDTVLPHGGGADGKAPLLIPANSYVVYSGYALGQNREIYGSDVEAFRPERWEQDLRPTPIQRMSFGAGTRACLGERLAREILGYTLWRLAREFQHIASCDERPWEEARAFTFFNQHGTHVMFS